MIPELGHYALVLALALGLIQAITPIVGARGNDAALMGLASSTSLMQFAFVGLAFLALIVCYVTSDFSVATVYENAHSTMPLIYKVTSAWGNHEGSMLLWVLILSFFGALVGVFGSNLPATLKAYALAVQSWIACAFYLFILFTSNPFSRLAQAPFEGRDLNPILQDIGLAIHPPLLYLGYVGFSIAFSFAIAALIERRIDAAWGVCAAVLGLLRTWMGWFLVLGSRGKCLVDAMAGWHGASAFRRGHGETQRTKDLDAVACHTRLLTFAHRYFSRAVGRAHIGAYVRQRSGTRRVHPRNPGRVYWWRSYPVCLARSHAQTGRAICAHIARRGTRTQ